MKDRLFEMTDTLEETIAIPTTAGFDDTIEETEINATL